MTKKKATPTTTVQGIVSEEDRAVLEYLAFQSGETLSAFVAKLIKTEIDRQRVSVDDRQAAVRRFKVKEAKKRRPPRTGDEEAAA